MASDIAASPLMSLPLELRHRCFEYAAVRDTPPKKLLRYWFEKKEVKELVANEVAANPTGPAPRVVYQQEHEEDSDVPEPEDEEDQEGESEGEDNDDEEDHAEDEDEAGHGDGDGETNQDNENDPEVEDGGDDREGDEATQAQDTTQAPTPAQISATTPQQHASAVDHTSNAAMEDELEEEAVVDEADAPAADTTAGGSQDAGRDETMAGDDDEEEEEEGDDNAGNDENEDAEVGDGDGAGRTATTAQQPPPPAPVVGPARKWRHIPNFMRITQCPPPVELLLASKQLNEEAKNWFYDVATLRINATGSFAHTSFFEEAFRQITDAAFSPMENIRKVEVLFSWDTTWLRADDTGCVEAIFPALLRQRSDFVHQILSQAPDLKEVTIHWHDSAQDNESANFMLDILAPFHSLNVHLTIKEHYIATDAKPHKRSIAGQRRVEFQAIVDAGLDRLF
jgi:hypothetical protein